MELLKHLQKGLASVALSAVAVTGVASAALGFTDDAEIPSWSHEAIEELMDQGVVSGNGDGSFAPNRQLNRAEVSKIIVLATGIDMDTTGAPHFPDVMEDAWYFDYIETMYNQGWINGYPDGMFRPGVGINRAELAKMVVNGFELDQDLSGAPHFSDVAAGDWFYGYVETAYNNGSMRGYGDGTFGPGNAVARAETVKVVYDTQLVALGSFTGVAAGTMEVALSGDTPRGTNIPFNATSVPFTTVELTASDDSDVEISSMTFTRLGLGDNDDFENVWLEIDGFKVGNDKSVNNDDVVELRFNPPVVIPAGQTIVADVVASMKFTATDKNTGHHNRFVLVSADDLVTSAANIAGNFPVEGEEMEVADYEVTSVEFGSLGSDTTIEVGDAFVEIGKFKLENQSTTNKDTEVRAITFKNDGSAELEDTLENVGLYVSGEQVSAETIMDGDYMTFRLDNGVTGGYIIEDGDSKLFSIRADIVSAEKGDTINFKIDNFEDVVAVEIGTAFGVRAESDGNGFSFANGETTGDASVNSGDDAEDNAARLKGYTIDSGDINISRDPSSLSNQEYSPGSNDVVFLTARVVVSQPVIVDGVIIEVEDTTEVAGNNDVTTVAGLNSSFDNFRLYINDKLIDTENEFVDATKDYLNFSTTFEMAGTSVIKLVGNVDSSADNGDKIKLGLSSTAFSSPEYISTGDQIDADNILGSAIASFVEIQQSILTTARTDGFAAQTVVAGVDNVTVMKFVLDNNDSGDVNVTSVSVQATGVDAASTYGNYTLAVFVDGVQQGSSRNMNSSGEATFNDVSIVVPSAGQKQVEIVMDTLEASANGVLTGTTTAGEDDTFDLAVVDVDADNVENGNTVAVNTGSAALSDIDTVASATYTFVQSGNLTVADGGTITNDTNIIVAGSASAPVYNIRFSASNDAIEVKDLYFVNDLDGTIASPTPTEIAGGDRFSFELYDEAGNLIQSKDMISGLLHFELPNNARIKVAKDNSTTVTIKAVAKTIAEAAQTAQQIDLAFNTAAGGSSVDGIEAVTASTGSDLEVVDNSATSSETYVSYRTMLTFANAASQPSFVSASGTDSAVFRFTATSDAAYDAILNTLTVKLSSSGVAVASGDVTLAKYSSSAYTGTPTTIATMGGVVLAADDNVDVVFAGFADEVADTNYYEIRVAQGYSNTASDNDSITGSFVNNAVGVDSNSLDTAVLDETGGSTAASIVWSDRSNNGAAGNYLNGFQLIYPSVSAGVSE